MAALSLSVTAMVVLQLDYFSRTSITSITAVLIANVLMVAVPTVLVQRPRHLERLV